MYITILQEATIQPMKCSAMPQNMIIDSTMFLVVSVRR